jgi:hypothetical protein
MNDKPVDQSASQLARANRMRLAAEEGARAMDQAAKDATAIRKNMARLRELRLAKEASTIREQIAAGNAPKTKAKKRSK